MYICKIMSDNRLKQNNSNKCSQNSLEQDLLVLLRAGLWGKTQATLTGNSDWAQIYNAASDYKVQGIVAEGIEAMGLS